MVREEEEEVEEVAEGATEEEVAIEAEEEEVETEAEVAQETELLSHLPE